MSFGKWLVTGLLSTLFLYGLIAYFATKDVWQLGAASSNMFVVIVVYAIYKGITS
jgi:hypothetical protein